MAEKKLTERDVNELFDFLLTGRMFADSWLERIRSARDLALQALAQPAQDVRREALEDCKRVVQNLVSGYLIEAEALKKQGAVNGATYVHTHAMGAQAAANAIAALEGNTHG
jgi:hypothetical protein